MQKVKPLLPKLKLSKFHYNFTEFPHKKAAVKRLRGTRNLPFALPQVFSAHLGHVAPLPWFSHFTRGRGKKCMNYGGFHDS